MSNMSSNTPSHKRKYNGHIRPSSHCKRKKLEYSLTLPRTSENNRTGGFKPLRSSRLDQLVQLSPNEALFTVKPRNTGFKELINGDKLDTAELISSLHLISHVCKSSQRETVKEFLQFLLTDCTSFVNNRVIPYLMTFQFDFAFEIQCHLPSINFLLDITEQLQLVLPQQSLFTTQILIPQLKDIIIFVMKKRGHEDADKFLERVERLSETKSALTERLRNDRVVPSTSFDTIESNDFRKISIFPTIGELVTPVKPLLRPNIVNGRYKNANHYLDIQFRLLREDFIRPLREDIVTYRNNFKNDRFAVRLRNVYENVTVSNTLLNEDGIVNEIVLDRRQANTILWRASKRLLTGALVVFTFDDFETCYFGTLSFRDAKALEKGVVMVKFQNPNEIIAVKDRRFVMMETQGYFEASRHVLSALQDINPESFPLMEYIVELRKDISKPDYLHVDSEYCFRWLIDPTSIINSGHDNSDSHTTRVGHYFKPIHETTQNQVTVPLNRTCGCPFDPVKYRIFADSSWPTADMLSLDPFQYQALQSALRQKLCIIQGPPGTGKTFVGLKIIQVLIHNENKWNCPENRGHILVVCYTNHALDQFLEGVTRLTDRIVRIGGRCQSETMQPYTMNQQKKTLFNCRNNFQVGRRRFANQGNYVNRAFQESKQNLKRVIDNIETKKGILNECLAGMIPESFPNEVISFKEQTSLSTSDQLDLQMTLYNWLHYIRPTEDYESKLYVGQSVHFKNDFFDEFNDVSNSFRNVQDNDEVIYDEQEIDRIMDERVDNDYQNGDVWYSEGRHRKKGRRLDYVSPTSHVTPSSGLTDADLLQTSDLWALSIVDRRRLFDMWLNRYVVLLQDEIGTLTKNYQANLRSFEEAKNEEETIIANRALVVGVTTTGAAKYRKLLRNIRSKIVIVEEAAEVLEAHIITSLSKDTQHLVLIGDHQQLKPNPTVYELAKKYKLDVSLFERLVSNEMPFTRLRFQHRMRPRISKLLVPHIYEDLENHSSVSKIKDVKGFARSVFFVNHQLVEQKTDNSSTRANLHEAQFLVSLCLYVLQQGYSPSQITILTTYVGQLLQIKRLLVDIAEGVKVAVVDNYQGEENDIILLSFVRSNESGTIGFLKSENRICVALSRAKQGLFCIGNFDLLASKSTLWFNIVSDLKEDHCLGSELELRCQNHKNVLMVSTSVDFDKVGHGGCEQPCDIRLACGHVCPRHCHPLEDHDSYVCTKPCERFRCDLNHKCHKLCHENCGVCKVFVSKKIPYCGHTVRMRCNENENAFSCTLPCEKTLDCSHKCSKECGKDCGDCEEKVECLSPCGHTVSIRCNLSKIDRELALSCLQPCEKILECGHKCDRTCGSDCQKNCSSKIEVSLLCGHKITTSCYKKKNPVTLLRECLEKCNVKLKCDHKCAGTCSGCFQGRLHVPCKAKCDKTLICGHICASRCSSTCPPCIQPCENRCHHSRCKRPCGDPCAPCREKCKYNCRHSSCHKVCNEICDRVPCNKPCKKVLRCFHKCVGLCGEPCPRLCRKCDKKKLDEIFFGDEDDPKALFLELRDCHHVFEVKGLTKWFEQQGGDEIKVLRCPRCNTPVRTTLYFGNEIKRVSRKVEKVKGIVFGKESEIKKGQWTLLTALKKEIVELKFLVEDRRVSDLLLLVKELSSNLTNAQNLVAFRNYATIISSLVRNENKLKTSTCMQKKERYTTRVERYLNDVLRHVSRLFKHQIARRHQTEQVIYDLKTETERCVYMVNFEIEFVAMYPTVANEAKVLYDSVMERFLSCRPFNEAIVADIRSSESKLNNLLGVKIGVSAEVRNEIVQAMGLKQGHWFACPNGHVYCITECGGAMQEGRCNECQAQIGGRQHALRSDNRVATGMDGASFSAWSERANMQNYLLD